MTLPVSQDVAQRGPGGFRRRVACVYERFRAKTWAEVSKIGSIAHDKYRGWHVVFRSVDWPGSTKPRRIRITQAPLFGRFASREMADQALTTIRQRAMTAPLYEVLSEYLATTLPENRVPHRWREQYLKAREVAMQRGEISKDRYRELRLLPGRGYLAFWDEIAVGSIDTASVERWHDWLRATFPHLGPVSIHHALADFRAFCGYLKRVGAIRELPEFPTVRVPRKGRRVPDRSSLDKILAKIPEPERGLFLARSLAGLRPAEARRVNVADYRPGVLTIPAAASKTGEVRVLPIAAVAPELAAWIQTHRKGAKPWEPLFPAPRARDRRWRPTPERRVWVQAIADAEVEHVAPNMGGRHAFATHEIAAGTDAYALKDWMGHSSLSTTQVYVEVDAITLARRMRPSRGPVAQETAVKPAKNA